MRLPLRALIAIVFGTAWLVGYGALAWRTHRMADRFDLVAWELRTLPMPLLTRAGAPLRHDPPADEALRRYFAFTVRRQPDAVALEGRVEMVIAARVSAAARDLGIGRVPVVRSLPGMPVFPPVAFELSPSPPVLVESPRAAIRQDGALLLRPDLSREQAVVHERSIEQQDPERSALVVPSGGVAAYPAIVDDSGTYADTVQAVAHEWTHHYLAFFPLGRAYFASAEARTINETVADMVGDEVAALVLARDGDPTIASDGGSSQRAGTSAAAADRALRDLRVEVDGLLAAGRVADAELRMEAVRRDLDARGVHIRRINQAFFAWYGNYAARPDAVDPLGQQLRALREQTGSLARFVELVRSLDTRAAVQRALSGARD